MQGVMLPPPKASFQYHFPLRKSLLSLSEVTQVGASPNASVYQTSKMHTVIKAHSGGVRRGLCPLLFILGGFQPELPREHPLFCPHKTNCVLTFTASMVEISSASNYQLPT